MSLTLSCVVATSLSDDRIPRNMHEIAAQCTVNHLFRKQYMPPIRRVHITGACVHAGEHTITAQTPVLTAPADAVATLSEVSTQQLHKHQGMPTRITVFLASQPGSMAGTDGAAGECTLQGFKVEYVQASSAPDDSNCDAAANQEGVAVHACVCLKVEGQEGRKAADSCY